jgi:hypothetical protein
MKIFEQHPSLVEFILIVALIFPALAASPQNKPAGQQQFEQGSSEPKPQNYDLEVKAGGIVTDGAHSKSITAILANVIDTVRNRYPDANIVISPGLGNIPVSDLKLRTSSIPEELEAIRVACGGKFEWSGGVTHVDQANLPTDAASNNRGLFTLREPTAPENQRIVEAFNIGPYLQSGREGEPESAGRQSDKIESKEVRERRTEEMLEQLKDIILDTISALHPDNAERPNFQFHRGASVLIVIGSRDSIEVARKVVNALPGQASLHPQMSASFEPGMNSAQREAFMRRYGLTPNGPQGDGKRFAPNPGGSEDPFRKRYGLESPPGSQPAADPTQKSQP